HDRAGAEAQIERARKVGGRPSKEALYAAAEVLLENQQYQGVEAALLGLIKEGGDGFDARMKLGELYARQGRTADAERELGLAKKLDPELSDPYEALAKLYLKAKRDDQALAELEAAAR